MPSCFRIAKTEKNHGVCSLVKFSWLIPLFNYSLRQDCAKEEKKKEKKKKKLEILVVLIMSPIM